MDNNTFGSQFNASTPVEPKGQEDNRFAPPPNNIFIRTMNSDIESLKENGGSLPSFEAPNATYDQPVVPIQSTPTPPESPSVNPEPSANPFAQTIGPIPPPIVPPINPTIENILPPENINPEIPKKKKIPAWLLMILGIVILGGVGFAFYKFAWPKLFKPKTPDIVLTGFKCGCDADNLPTCTSTGTGIDCSNAGNCACEQVTTTTTTTLPPTPYVEIPNNATTPLAITSLGISFAEKSLATSILAMIKTEVNKATPVGTLKPIRIDYKGQDLDTTEIMAALFKNVPVDLSGYIGSKYAVYAYYGSLSPTLGFIVEVTSPDAIRTAMTNWEKKGMLDGVSNLFLKTVVKPSPVAFKDRVLPIGGTARYIAYKTKNVELNYLLYGNYLIITTGKDNLEALVNNLANP
jgi:hypothetical protein